MNYSLHKDFEIEFLLFEIESEISGAKGKAGLTAMFVQACNKRYKNVEYFQELP